MDEIMQWAKTSEAEKQNIMQLCHTRRAARDAKFKPLP